MNSCYQAKLTESIHVILQFKLIICVLWEFGIRTQRLVYLSVQQESHVKWWDALDVISSIDSNMKTKKNTGKAAVMAIIALMILPTALNAQDNYLESVWEDANLAYTEGRWQDAVDGYQLIADASLESAPLWCNLGNAYYRVGNMSKAILCYERSLKIDPSYDDARFNLELLNSTIQDRIDLVPEFVLKAWSRDICYIMDSNAWAVCFIIFIALALALALLSWTHTA